MSCKHNNLFNSSTIAPCLLHQVCLVHQKSIFSKFTIIFGLHYQQKGEKWTTSLPCLLPRFARLNVNSSEKVLTDCLLNNFGIDVSSFLLPNKQLLCQLRVGINSGLRKSVDIERGKNCLSELKLLFQLFSTTSCFVERV